MIIDEKVKKKLLTFDDIEDDYKQFERKCAHLSRLSGLVINPRIYQLQYNLHVSSIDTYMELQNESYKSLMEKYPNIDFGMSGRLKSPFSHYEKVIRKFIDLFEKDEIKPVEILDDYAMKIFIFSINYPVDKISIDSEGIYVDSGADEFRICDKDAFEFEYENRILNVVVNDGQTNVWIDNGVPYISTTINDKDIVLPLTKALNYKRSNKEDLVPYCYEIQKDIESFYNSNGFVTKKRKDYISRPKESGYASNQCSFYSDELSLGLECQIRTQDMEAFNNMERKFGYKPNEQKISSNSLNRVPRFILTGRFKDGCHTFPMSDAECFEYVFGMTLQEYRKRMRPTIEFKNGTKKDEEETTR